jgi:hypothetical protein
VCIDTLVSFIAVLFFALNLDLSSHGPVSGVFSARALVKRKGMRARSLTAAPWNGRAP